jgi:hypothetical protein
MALTREMNVLMTKWNELDFSLRASVLYVSCTIAFLVFYSCSDSLFAIIGRAAFGFFTLVLLPGAFVVALILPPRLRNIASTLLIGLLLAVVEVQVVFIIALLSSVHAPLILWLSFFSSVIVLASISCYRVASYAGSVGESLGFEADRQVYCIIAAAIVIRVIMALLAKDCIAPDAALYADYARGIIDGSFSSSVVNDIRIYSLWNGFQYCFHQAFVYLYALSWVLLPPGTSGPILILVVSGVLLILSSYRITKNYFGNRAAKSVAAILAFHPLFVFHSAVGYGPEITSLAFMIGGLAFLLENSDRPIVTYVIVGLLFGLVDLIWYPNYLLLCVAIPILIMGFKWNQKLESVTLGFIMGLALLARLFYLEIYLFLSCWFLALVIVGVAHMKKPSAQIRGLGGLAFGIFAIITLWRWPVQVSTSGSLSWFSADYAALGLQSRLDALMLTAPNPNLSVLFAPISLEVAGRFILFSLFHITPILLFAILSGLTGSRMKYHAITFLLAGLAAAFGTLKLFSAFALYKDPLLAIYLFSDSRFFLFMTLMGVLSSGAFFAKIDLSHVTAAGATLARISSYGKRNRLALVLGIILVGYLPAYLVMPSGLSLVRIEERYGWYNLTTEIDMIGNENSTFLVDRAPEFSWLTGRNSAKLRLSEYGLSCAEAYVIVASRMRRYNAAYLIMDAFTIAHWRTLEPLLHVPITLGSSVMFDRDLLRQLPGRTEVGPVPALTLAAETEKYGFQDYARVFYLGVANFSLAWHTNNLGEGWSAGDSGLLTNSTGTNYLEIGSGENSTFTHRTEPFNLDVEVTGGFFVCDVENGEASIDRIEIFDDSGHLVALGEHVSNNLYYALIGDAILGDIQVHCVGLGGQYVTINYLSLWQLTT